MNGILYYDSKYGSTEQIGRWIISSLQNTRIQKMSDGLKINGNSDFYILGTPIFIGKPMQSVLDFIALNKKALSGKPVFLFVTSWAQSTQYKNECKKFIDLLEAHLSPVVPAMARSLPGRLFMDKIAEKDRRIMERLLRRIDERSDEFDSKEVCFNDQTSQKQSEEYGSEIYEWLESKGDLL